MSDIALFDRLPDCVVPGPGRVVLEPEHLDSVMIPVEHHDIVMRPVECLLLPTQTDNSNDIMKVLLVRLVMMVLILFLLISISNHI